MHIFDTAAAITAASANTTDPQLAKLISDRVRDWTANGLLDMTHLLIVEAGDTEEQIVEAAGFSPLVNPIDGVRWGSPGFHGHHDLLQLHDGWFELIFTVGNEGWACVMFVQDDQGAATELLSFCRTHAAAGGQ